MNVLGIVAEYNPFHNGHLYMLNKVTRSGDFDAVVCVMSGNFLQRGEPALCSKWARTEMALACGADLVIELPFCFAVRSAYFFARGALELLSRTGIITHIAFGSESGDLELLRNISSIIATEPADFKKNLKKQLSLGVSYPVARAKALCNYLDNKGKEQEIETALSGSNNILALEYLRVIKELGLSITPLTVKRIGSDYHNLEINKIASATAIRQIIKNNLNPDLVKMAMPPQSFNILKREINCGQAPVFMDNLELAILYRLRSMQVDEIAQLYEVTEGLHYRISEAAFKNTRLHDLISFIKSRRYSLTRINRILLYALFHISREMIKDIDRIGPTYLHILGFTDKGQKILQKIKKRSSLTILSRGKDVKSFYEKEQGFPAGDIIAVDVMSSDIYNLLLPDHSKRIGGTDFTTSPFIAH